MKPNPFTFKQNNLASSKKIFQSRKTNILSLLILLFSINTEAQITVAGSNTKDGSYTSLTKASGAFAALNSVSQATRNITITITSDVTTEDGANALTGSAGMWTTLTISPSGARTISGTMTKPLIDLNGADNVTINGLNASGNSLVLSNASTSTLSGTSTIRFINDAKTNTIKNCTIYGSCGSGLSPNYAGVILFNTATVTTGTGNDDNIIEYNNISNAGTRPINVLFSVGGANAGQENSGNIFRYNNVYDFFNPSTSSNGLTISIYNTNWTIQGNSFYETTASPGFATTANNLSYTIMNILSASYNDYKIIGNYIGGNAQNCSGTWYKKGDYDNAFVGISIRVGSGTASSIQGNTITGFNWANNNVSNTTTVYFYGITTNSSTGDINIGDVTGNTIGASTGNDAITFSAYYCGGSIGTTSSFYGILMPNGSTGNMVVKNNTIGSITTANTSGTSGCHIYGIYRFTGSTTNIENNIIGSTDAGTSNSLNASSASTGNPQQVWGIRCDASGTNTITGNTISKLKNSCTNTTAATTNYCTGIITTSGTNTISNNTVRDLINSSSSVSADYQNSVVGIAQYGTTAAAQTVTGNTIYNLQNSNSNGSFAGKVMGIYYNGPTTTSNVYKNFIYGLTISSTSTSGLIYGIYINAGVTNYYNNIISLKDNGAAALYGIFETGTASNATNLYYNTVYLGGSPTTGTNINSYALYSAVTTNTRNIRNNIFCNVRSNNGATGKHYAAYFNYAVTTNLTLSYNDYYISGTGGVLGYYNAADKTSVPIVATQDGSSLNTNPNFTVAGGTTATNYFLSASLPAATGTGITTDFSGITRLSVPRMGAWEVNWLLAVTLVSFDAQVTSIGNLLKWKAFTDNENDYFEIQRSADGFSFMIIAQQAVKGNNRTEQSYSYNDANPLTGKNYYRLRLASINGNTSLSGIVKVQANARNNSLQLYPNPAINGKINVIIPSNSLTTIFNSVGNIVYSAVLSEGHHVIDISQFPKGMYTVKCGNEQGKVLVQ